MPTPVPDHQWVILDNPTDYESLFDRSHRPGSGPLAAHASSARGNGLAQYADFPWLGSWALVLRPRALTVLRGCLGDATLIPLSLDGDQAHVLCPATIDAVDEQRSVIKRIAGSPDAVYFLRLALNPSRVGDADVFRLPHRGSGTYVSQRFVDTVGNGGLVGLLFDPVGGPELRLVR
jgi:hypothetical protein